MGSEPTIGSFDLSGQLRTRDDVLRHAVQGMRDEQLRTGKQIVASVDSANMAITSGLNEQTRMLGELGGDLRGIGDEVLHLRYSLERGMHALESQARLQSELLAVIAQATLAPSRTKAQEFERRAFSLLQRSLLAEARSEAERSLEEEPYQWGAHHLLAQVSEAEAAPEEAAEHYRLAVRYAAGIAPRQQALSLGALARMSLVAGDAAGAEGFAWQAYMADSTAERLYTSAVYLAATEGQASDEGVEDRLYRAVIDRPGLAVVAMAEPTLVRREQARDAALIRVSAAMAARLDVAFSGLDELVKSLDGFLRYHQSMNPEGIRAFVHARVVSIIGEQQTRAWWDRQIAAIVDEMLSGRSDVVGSGATAILNNAHAGKKMVAAALSDRTIETLYAGLSDVPPLLAQIESELRRLMQASEMASGRMMQVALDAERYLEQNRASVGKWSTPTDDTIRFNRKAATGPAARVSIEYLEPIREYYCGTVKFMEAIRPDVLRPPS